MGWKSSLAIHLGFWLYLVVGGLIYYYIENPGYNLPPVEKPMTINSSFCQDLMSSVEHYAAIGVGDNVHVNSSFEIWFEAIKESCNNLTLNLEKAADGSEDVAWEFSSALFLCMTILTTIGYGTFSPKSNWGKVFCIFYGFVGIPICGVFLASTSDYFSNIFLHFYEHRRKQKKNDDKRRSIFIAAVIFLIPGLAVFFFFPAALFSVIEGWSYLDATYFSFLTLTTIGFGDIVAAQQTNCSLLWLYRISWIIWVMLGIAYWAIVINFITKALKSKKIRQQWAKTSLSLSVQAQEMKRVVKRQLSGLSNGPNGNLFLALKTKSAFDFALQFTGSMGKVTTKPEPKHRRLSLVDILTAFEASVPGFGLRLQQQQQQQSQFMGPSPPDFAEDNVNNKPSSPAQNDFPPWPSSYSSERTASIDSNFDDNSTILSTYLSLNPSRKTSATNSGISIPCRWFDDDESIRSIYLSLNPSRKTSATSNGFPGTANPSTENPPLRDLLIEAIMILNEAETNGTDLSQ